MKTNMRLSALGLGLAVVLAAASVPLGGTEAAPSAQFIFGVDRAGDASLVPVQYIFDGRNYCWYDDAWYGPGWYRCGYAWRRGYGWGGYYGWHRWRGGHPRVWYGHRRWDRRYRDHRPHGGHGPH